ncbi:MAG: peptidyl-prolyl cis-trans isomerase [Flavobacteriales bacterium]
MSALRTSTLSAALCLAGAWTSCGEGPRSADAEFGRDVVASAYGEVLTWDSLASLVPDDLNLEDSAAFAERVLDRWMRERVMFAQARTQLQQERSSLEQALEAYRRSLLINTYETRYVESRLDTEVSDDEIEAYYEAHPELFTLHDHAVRVLYLHLPDPKAAAEARGANWSKKDQRDWKAEVKRVSAWLAAADSTTIPELERWCIERGAMHHVDHEAWWAVSELLDEVPLSLYRVEDQIQRTTPLSFSDQNRLYFVRFLDHGLKGKTAPLDVARDQITELVLQRRRQQLLDALRDTLFQKAWAEGDLRRENL